MFRMGLQTITAARRCLFEVETVHGLQLNFFHSKTGLRRFMFFAQPIRATTYIHSQMCRFGMLCHSPCLPEDKKVELEARQAAELRREPRAGNQHRMTKQQQMVQTDNAIYRIVYYILTLSLFRYAIRTANNFEGHHILNTLWLYLGHIFSILPILQRTWSWMSGM